MHALSITRPRPLAVVLLAALAVAACTASPGASSLVSPLGSASSATSAPASSTPAAGGSAGPVSSAADAFRAVQARSPWFDGVKPKDASVAGQAAWWTAAPGASGAWTVTVNVGWGDCPAGCIDHHTWAWTVSGDGTVSLASETGAALPADQRTSLGASATTTGIGGQVTAGPVCPVVRPGQSGCDAKPVAGAVLVVQDAGGKDVARFTTDASGLFRIALPAGSYTLVAQPVEGLMGTPGPQPVKVVMGQLEIIAVGYDTGIR
jgi:hypothetical protein